MGQQDIPLNQTGIEQIEDSCAELTHHTIKTIAVSPLIRTRQTAEIIQKRVNAPIVVINELKEALLGEAEGHERSERAINDMLARWRDGLPLKGAEPYTDFRKRACVGINKALALEGPVLIVSHGGIYRTLSSLIKSPFETSSNGQLFLCVPRQHAHQNHAIASAAVASEGGWQVKSLFTPE